MIKNHCNVSWVLIVLRFRIEDNAMNWAILFNLILKDNTASIRKIMQLHLTQHDVKGS